MGYDLLGEERTAAVRGAEVVLNLHSVDSRVLEVRREGEAFGSIVLCCRMGWWGK
jgi:hypothetical protein